MLEKDDFKGTSVTSFNEEVEAKVARITPYSILAAAVAAEQHEAAEAVFISCTNLRCAGIIVEAERRTGKPVLLSDLALLWHMLRIAGLETQGIIESRLVNYCN